MSNLLREKIIFIIICAFSSSLWANILTDPSFENWLNPYQPGGTWRVEDTTYTLISQESTLVFDGNYALKMTRRVAGTGNNRGIFQRVQVSPGLNRYLVRCRFYDSSDSVRGGLIVTWRRADSTAISSWRTIYTINSPTWQIVQLDSTAPNDANWADVIIRTYGINASTPSGGTMVIDSAVFVSVTSSEETNEIKNKFMENFIVTPNPFSNYTKIKLNIEPDQLEFINIYDLRGNIVKTVSKPTKPNFVAWNGRDYKDRLLPAGVYFISVKIQHTSEQIKKVVFLR